MQPCVHALHDLARKLRPPMGPQLFPCSEAETANQCRNSSPNCLKPLASLPSQPAAPQKHGTCRWPPVSTHLLGRLLRILRLVAIGGRWRFRRCRRLVLPICGLALLLALAAAWGGRSYDGYVPAVGVRAQRHRACGSIQMQGHKQCWGRSAGCNGLHKRSVAMRAGHSSTTLTVIVLWWGGASRIASP